MARKPLNNSEEILQTIIHQEGMCREYFCFLLNDIVCPLKNFCEGLPLLLDGGKINSKARLAKAKETLQALRKLKWLEDL